MIKPITWNINRADGSYVGQSSAFVEDVAFTKCMSATGVQVVPGDIKTEGLAETPGRITYGSEDFFITPQS